jgi:hypothetical protein
VIAGDFRGTLGIFHITLFSIVGGFPAKHGYLHQIRLVSGGQDKCSLLHSLVHMT